LAEGSSNLDECLEHAREGVLLVHGPSLLLGASEAGRSPTWQRLAQLVSDDRERHLLILSDTADGMATLRAQSPSLIQQLRLFEFADYSIVELGRVLESMAKASHYRFSRDARIEILNCLHYVVERDGCLPGNATKLRELFEEAVGRQARRVAEHPECTPTQLTLIEPGDFVLDGVPEATVRSRPRFVLTDCVRCGASGRLPSSLLGTRIQCRSCRHEMFADWGLPLQEPRSESAQG
jgi:hypothetical protein